MSVNIGISANPSQAVTAFDAVRDAIRRAGQEGRAFRDLDLSHPELGGFANDLRQMQGQLEDLMRVSRGATATAARRVFNASPGGANPLDWAQNDQEWRRHFPDDAERNRLQGRVQGFVTAGTRFAPAPAAPPPVPSPPPPAPPPPGAPPRDYSNEAEDAAKGLPPIISSAARAAVQGATFGLSMAGIGGVRSAISNSYQSAVQEGSSNDNLFRRMPELSQSFDTLRESIRRASDGMGITYQEAQRMAGIFVRTNGEMGTRGQSSEDSLRGWVQMSAGFGRSAGIEAGTSASMFARAANFQSGEKFAMLVGDAAAKGFQTGNMERVMESILRYQETTSRLLVTNGGNVEGFAGMWAAMNATGNPGMRGDNATAMIGQLDNAVRQGGMGGHASEAVTWRAFAKAGVKDPYEMQYLQEGGMFQRVGNGTLFDAVSGEINHEYAGAPARQRQAALARHFGITMHQAEAMQGLRPANVTGTRDMLDGYGIDPTKINPTSFVDIAKMQSSGDWEGGRKRLLDRRDLSTEERTSLGQASGATLQELVVRMTAAKGMVGTSSSDHTDASTGLLNRMTEFGDLVVRPMTALKNGITDLADAIKMLGRMVGSGPGFGAGLPPTLGGGAGAAEGAGGVIPSAYRVPAGGAWGGRGGGAGAGAGASGGISQGTSSATKAAFIAKWRPEAERIAAAAGTSADNIIAHWGQETGWGRSEHDNNPGNLQARVAGANTVTRGDTHANGQRYQAPFMKFDTPAGSADEYLGWIRRHNAVGPGGDDSPEAFGERLRRGGYMENPNAPADIARARRGMASEPHGMPAPAPPPAAQAISASFEPLRVIHEDRAGNPLRTEFLPVQGVPLSIPYGIPGPAVVEGRRAPNARREVFPLPGGDRRGMDI